MRVNRGRISASAPALAACLALVALVGCGSPEVAHPEAPRTPRPTVDPAEQRLLAQAKAITAPAAPPVRLVIPEIGVNAAVEAVGVDSQGRIAAPARTTDVGWYRLGPAPGDAGDAVIDGHLDWYNGPAVFWRLADLRPGDPVTVVRADGSQVRFLVTSVGEAPYNASISSLFTTVGVPSLTLITCAGTWDQARQTYLQRLIVHTTLDPSPSNAPTGTG